MTSKFDVTGIYMLAMCASNSVFALVYLVTGELFLTNLRTRSIATCSTLLRIFRISAAFMSIPDSASCMVGVRGPLAIPVAADGPSVADKQQVAPAEAHAAVEAGRTRPQEVGHARHDRADEGPAQFLYSIVWQCLLRCVGVCAALFLNA